VGGRPVRELAVRQVRVPACEVPRRSRCSHASAAAPLLQPERLGRHETAPLGQQMLTSLVRVSHCNRIGEQALCFVAAGLAEDQ